MAESIEQVTLESAAEQLKAKIRSGFIELLPEEQWKAMVKAELTRFTQSRTERDKWNHHETTVPSDFSRICREVFTEHVKAEIKALIIGPEWQAIWGHDGKLLISDAIKQWCTENSKQLIENTVLSLAGAAAQSVIAGMRHQ